MECWVPGSDSELQGTQRARFELEASGGSCCRERERVGKRERERDLRKLDEEAGRMLHGGLQSNAGVGCIASVGIKNLILPRQLSSIPA